VKNLSAICSMCEYGTVTDRRCDFCHATFFVDYQRSNLSGRNGEQGAPGIHPSSCGTATGQKGDRL
jgi:hypothetical protein